MTKPISVPTESRPTALSDDPAISAWGKYNFFVCADKGQHDMRLAFIAGYKRALHDAQSQLCDPADDAELAELLNLLMATNVHGAILQLRDHLDGDKRLIDNYRRLYKRAESASSSLLPVPDVELISAKVHDSWMATKRQMGFHGPEDGCAECQRSLNESALGGFRCERFHADLIPYEQLTDAKKELDRATVRTVLKAMSELASLPVGESREPLPGEKL